MPSKAFIVRPVAATDGDFGRAVYFVSTGACGIFLLGGIFWDAALERRVGKPEGGSVSFACCVNPYGVFTRELQAAGVPEGGKIALVGEPQAEHFHSWLNPAHFRLQLVVTDPSRFFSERRWCGRT